MSHSFKYSRSSQYDSELKLPSPPVFSYCRRVKSGHITCYSDQTYHLLLTVLAINHS